MYKYAFVVPSKQLMEAKGSFLCHISNVFPPRTIELSDEKDGQVGSKHILI